MNPAALVGLAAPVGPVAPAGLLAPAGPAVLLSLTAALLGALAGALLERFRCASQPSGAIERGFHPICVFVLAEGSCCLAKLVPQLLNAAGDFVFSRIDRLLRGSPVDQVLRIAQLVGQAVVANGARSLGHLARRSPLVRACIARRAIDLLLERVHPRFEIGLLVGDTPRAVATCRRIRHTCELPRLRTGFLLSSCELVGLTDGIVDVTLRPRRLILRQPPLRFAQTLERRSRLTSCAGVTARRRAPHCIGGLLHLPRGLHQVGTVLFARQPLEPSRGLLGLLGQRPLLCRSAGRGASLFERAQPLPLRLLLLPPRKLLQLLEQFVELTIAGLLLRLIGGLVAARHLFELLLEDVGELLLLRASAAAATTAALLDADLVLVLLFRLLQNLQRLVLGRQRTVGTDGGELAFGLLHRVNRLRQELGDLLERRILLDELTVHTRDQPFDLLPQPRLREPDDRRALAKLGRRIVPPVALHVERRRDDLPLLLGERLDLTAGSAATAASAARHATAPAGSPSGTDECGGNTGRSSPAAPAPSLSIARA